MEIPRLLHALHLATAAACLCLTLSCAHGEEAPARAPAAVSSEPAAIAGPGPKAAAAPSCEGVGFRWPARGAVTSAFGRRAGRMHKGIDISASRNDLAVRAAAAGTVRFSDTKPGYGRVVILRHGRGYESVYAHNQDNLVAPGARVQPGQVIADMGSTGKVSGPHLHFEIRVDGRPVDPLGCLPPRKTSRP